MDVGQAYMLAVKDCDCRSLSR